MFRTAARQLKVGNSVVVDCPLSRKSLYADAQTLAAEYNADLAIVECVTLEKDIWQARLAARSRSGSSDRAHKPADWETVQNLIAGYQGACNWTSDGSCKLSKHVVIDTSRGSAMELAASVAIRIGLLSPPADATAGWPNPSRTGLED
ncbi:hypothetical protein WJX84_010486 [Apatococcus fuscideae]|uniref:Uncharacterized protein n=1 Tax=Apatococcus fuscideae TaxID=2026836 RepID=A0AAW1TH56_9CHLO